VSNLSRFDTTMVINKIVKIRKDGEIHPSFGPFIAMVCLDFNTKVLLITFLSREAVLFYAYLFGIQYSPPLSGQLY
jgi:hypothetical protein